MAARNVLRGEARRQVCSKLGLQGGARRQDPSKIAFDAWEVLPACQRHFFLRWAARPPRICGFFSWVRRAAALVWRIFSLARKAATTDLRFSSWASSSAALVWIFFGVRAARPPLVW